MPHWNTETIIADLKKIPGVKNVESQGQGGSYDTDNLLIDIKGSGDNLFICGFDPDSDDGIQPDNVEVPFVELTDGLDSRGGLQSHNKKTSLLYLKVREYFHNRDFEVVNSIKAYF
jgi:hypothetical protein